MHNKDIDKVLNRVRTVVYHLGTFEGSFPRILKKVPIYTRSHLIVFYEVVPYLKHLLKFVSDSVPVIGKILGLATEGKSDLEKASEYLRTINQSSETAVAEIFASLDQVGGTLQKALKEAESEEQKKTLQEANMQLMGIMNALQFQDITSQKIEATHALLAHLGDGLIDLIHELGVKASHHNIQVREGTYDAEAAFDRDTAGDRQGEIDDLIESGANNTPESPPKPAEQAKPNATSSSSQDNIDDLVASTQDDEPADSTSQDDIDDLVASTQGNEPTSQNDIDDLVASTQDGKPETPTSQDDIDDLVASTQDGKPESPANQDDIDHLVSSAKDTAADELDVDALVDAAQNGSTNDSSETEIIAPDDDIDALVSAAQNGETETESADDTPVDLDSVDDLVASTAAEAANESNKEPEEEKATVDQDDIDALLGDQ